MKEAMSEQAVLGGGCFWCMEAIFEHVAGVSHVEPGYAGGSVKKPSYEQVCTGQTGYAEVVRITFDQSVTSYKNILNLFWKAHDPTTLNRQGADVGSQYRSIILWADAIQRDIAETSIKIHQELSPSPVVTEIKMLEAFYPAEAYHQHYFEKHPYAGYCRIVIAPKLDKFRALNSPSPLS
jgi:peptide-methionine (S)-S-oxide reductase